MVDGVWVDFCILLSEKFPLLLLVYMCWVFTCLGAATFLTKLIDDFFCMFDGFSCTGLLYTLIFFLIIFF